MDILLAAVRMDAAPSLEPILELIATLARDLQADFLPYLPRVTAALSDLVHSGKHQCREAGYSVLACQMPCLPSSKICHPPITNNHRGLYTRWAI